MRPGSDEIVVRRPGAEKQQTVVALTVLALAIGIWARFGNVTHKIYYQDEAVTSVRAAGYELVDVYALFDGRSHAFAEIRNSMSPARGRDVRATVASLAVEDPQHPPLYYALQAAWMRAIGDDPARMRILPVLLSLLALPLGFSCARELFGTRSGPFAMVALLAVSPFQILYSYQTREYGLLTVAILAASLALLRATRLASNTRTWAIYAIANGLGLYTYLLFAFVVIAYVAYVASLERFRATATARRFVVATATGIALAAPWFAVVYAHRATMSRDLDWAQTSYPLAFMASKWAFFTSATFFDLAYANVRFVPLALAVVLFAAYALVRVTREAPPRVASFVVTLTATSALLLVAQDIALHERFSTIARYLAPTWIGLEFAVAYTLGRALENARSRATQFAWLAAFALVLGLGGASAAVSSRASSWWENSGNRPLPEVATLLDRTPRSLVIVQNDYASMLSLAFLVPGDMRFQGTLGARPPHIVRTAGDPIYLFSPTEEMRATQWRARGQPISERRGFVAQVRRRWLGRRNALARHDARRHDESANHPLGSTARFTLICSTSVWTSNPSFTASGRCPIATSPRNLG